MLPDIDLYVNPANFTKPTVPSDAVEVVLGADAKQAAYLSKDHRELYVAMNSTADVVDLPTLWDVLKLVNPLDLKTVYLTSLSGIFPETKGAAKRVEFKRWGALTLIEKSFSARETVTVSD